MPIFSLISFDDSEQNLYDEPNTYSKQFGIIESKIPKHLYR